MTGTDRPKLTPVGTVSACFASKRPKRAMKRKDMHGLDDGVLEDWSANRKDRWDRCPSFSKTVCDLRDHDKRGKCAVWMKHAESFHVQDWIYFMPCKPPLKDSLDLAPAELEDR